MSFFEGGNFVVVSNDDHSNAVINALRNLFDTKRGTDFDFCWEGRSLRAHRTILELFLAPEMIKPVINEHVPEVKREVPDDDCNSKGILYIMLEFLYKGEVHVPEEELEELLRVAKALNFNMLVDAIDQTCYFNNGKIFENSVKIDKFTSCCDYECLPSNGSEEDTVKPCYVDLGREVPINEFHKKQVEVLLQSDFQEDICSHEYSPMTEKSKSGLFCKSTNEPTISKPLTEVVKEQPTAEYPLPKIELGTFCQYSGPGCSKSPVDFKMIKIEAEEVQDDLHSLVDDGLPEEGVIGSVDLSLVQYSRDEGGDSPPGHDSSHEGVTDESCNLLTEGSDVNALSQKSSMKPGNEFHCVHCDFESPSKLEYFKHLCLVHGCSLRDEQGTYYKCPECNYSSPYLHYVKRHLLSKHTKEKPFACQHCSYATTKKTSLDFHLSTIHNLGVGHRSCEIKASSQKSSLKRGIELQCVHCDFESPNKLEYFKHICFVHGCSLRDEQGTIYKCPECNYSSPYLHYVKRHMLSKHIKDKPKPYACQHCSYATTKKTLLDFHQNTIHNLGVGLYVCETCGKGCRDSFKLQCHTRTHTQERPFKCEICNFSANMKHNLKVHLLNVHKIK